MTLHCYPSPAPVQGATLGSAVVGKAVLGKTDTKVAKETTATTRKTRKVVK